jgi:hypothetical protein
LGEEIDMTAEVPQPSPTEVGLHRRPQLSHRVQAEQGRHALLLLAAIAGTVVFGACCSFGWREPDSVVSVSAIAMQLSLISLPWWWFFFRLTHYTFTADLQAGLARHGSPRRVRERIDAELRDAPDVWLRGKESQVGVFIDREFLALTPHWLVQVRPRHAAVMAVEEIVWVYKRVVPRRLWLRGADFRIQIACRLRDGSTQRLEGREDDLDALVEELFERRPGLLTGWRGENFDIAARGPKELAKAHDERATAFADLAPEGQEAWLDESYDRYEGAVRHVE